MTKRLFGAAIFMVLLLFTAGAAHARPIEVSLDFFYSSLAPYGEWQTLNPWGWVWCPYDVGTDWRPYTNGDWVYTDDGWTFVSPENWAWATYHYGRWGFDDEYGWFWVPDVTWGPAWVAWRFGGGFIGWCPLPPGIRWSFAVGLEVGGFDFDRIAWSRWSFCDARRFTDGRVGRFVVPASRNIMLLRTTRDVTAYSFEGQRVINNNVNLTEIQRYTGRPVTRYRLAEIQGNRPQAGRVRGTEVQVFRPAVSSRAPEAPPSNILPPRRTSGTPQQLEQRQQRETQTLNRKFQTQQNEMQNRHQQELKATQRAAQPSAAPTRKENPPRRAETQTARPQEKPQTGTADQQALQQRQQEEKQALQEEQQRQARVLQNRQKRETAQHAAARQAPAKAPAPKPKKKAA